MSESAPKRPRSDSARNRQALVAAAREVFAEHGFGATLDDIARHAGLGTGTAYRHFPNKHAIAAEVLRDATEQIAVDAREALDVADPWQGLVQFCERVAARQAADRGLYETLTGQGTTKSRRASGHTSSRPSRNSSRGHSRPEPSVPTQRPRTSPRSLRCSVPPSR
jgi:AcrR family transcriptional regulator